MVYYKPGLDSVFRALGDPTRRTILERLRGGERGIGELAEGFAMTLPAVSKHVRVLEAAGLVRVERRGRVRVCRLEAQRLAEASSWLEDYRRYWEAALDRLGRYVEREEEE